MSFSRQQIFRRVVFHLSISYQVIELITSSQSVLLTGGGGQKGSQPNRGRRPVLSLFKSYGLPYSFQG